MKKKEIKDESKIGKVLKNAFEHRNLDDHGQPLNRNFSTKRLTERTIDELIGICKGLICDDTISREETQFLISWLENNKKISDIWPINILSVRIEKMLSDNVIDETERKEVLLILKDITGGQPIKDNIHSMSTLLPFCNPAPDIIFKDKAFCFTGNFFYGTRDKCQIEIIKREGNVHKNLTQKTNFLVIGSIGSTDWMHSTHGRKIEYAVELKNKGVPVAIVSEEHWANYL